MNWLITAAAVWVILSIPLALAVGRIIRVADRREQQP